MAPTAEDPAECVTDKGYHSRAVLKALDNGPWKTRIAEPKQKDFAPWRGRRHRSGGAVGLAEPHRLAAHKRPSMWRADMAPGGFRRRIPHLGRKKPLNQRAQMEGNENIYVHIIGRDKDLPYRIPPARTGDELRAKAPATGHEVTTPPLRRRGRLG